jgi:hypothetical protein
VDVAEPGTATVTVRAPDAPEAGQDSTRFEITAGRINITPSTVVLAHIDETMQLAAVARDTWGRSIAGVRTAWRSLNPLVAVVDSSGRVAGRAAGLALIVASAVCCGADTAVVTVAQQGLALR